MAQEPRFQIVCLYGGVHSNVRPIEERRASISRIMFEKQIRSVFVPECVDLGLMMHVQYERVGEFSFTEGPSLYDYIRSKFAENARFWYEFQLHKFY